MKKILLFILLMLIPQASAVTITEPVMFEVNNNVFITISNQTADYFNVSTSEHWLDITLSGSNINFTTTTNKTITALSYSGDVFTFTGSGAGSLTMTVTMINPNTGYGLYVDDVLVYNDVSDSNRKVSLSYTIGAGTHTFKIKQYTGTTSSPYVSGGSSSYVVPSSIVPFISSIMTSVENETDKLIKNIQDNRLFIINIIGFLLVLILVLLCLRFKRKK